ncbi:MAG: BLUF domain-containing protein [Candidatus Electrothrix sp. AUS4]|nr:BLUF domain-containing protein [Candidatus Electrothrix sp. AUS4]
MHLIIYISDYTGADKEIGRDLIKIHNSSIKNNPGLGITGVLFYHNRNFLQALEGEQEQLEKLMTTLEKDPRHTRMTRLVDTEVARRGFPDWQMDVFNLDADAVLNRRDLAIYEEMFSTQCAMDAPLFINMLKSLYEDVELYKMTMK